MVQTSGLPSGPHLVWCKRTDLRRPPTLTDAPEHGKAPCAYPRRIPPVREHLGAPSFLFAGACRPGRRAHLRALARWDLAGGATSLGSFLSAPPCCRHGALRRVEPVLPPALAFRKRRRIPHGGHQGFARGPGLRRDLLIQMLPRVAPPAHPERPRPHGLHRFAQAGGAVWRAGDQRLESACAQSPQALQTTVIARAVSGREGAADLPPIHPDAPDTQPAGFPPPAAPRLLHGSDQ